MNPSGFGGLIKRLFGQGPDDEFAVDAVVEPASSDRKPAGQELRKQPGAEPAKVAAAAKRVAMLRRILEFEDDLAVKVGQIHTARNMLLFMHQNIILKFEHLHELGILGDSSYATLTDITAKNQELLAGAGQEAGAQDPAALAQENESLRRQLKVLYDKHVKSDIISGKELLLEEEKAKLQGRLDDLKLRYEGAFKKIEVLQNENQELVKIEAKYKLLSAKAASAERGVLELEKNAGVLQELESQNRLLKGRVEHQERLIHAMSWGDPKHKEIYESITELGEQKRRLQSQLKGPDAFGAAWENISLEEDERAGMGELLQENRSLYQRLESTDAALEVSDAPQGSQGLLSSMEGLQEDTFHLKELALAKKDVEAQLDEKNRRIRDVSAMMEHLRKENAVLKQALEAKSRKVEAVAEDPAKKKMMEAVVGLRKENSRLQLEIENLHYVVSSISARNEAMETKLRQLIVVGRENRMLKQEAERKDNLLADYKKRDDELRSMKKFCYQLQSEYTKVKNEYAKAAEENHKLESKITKVRSEYEGMISEYNKLFDGE